MINNNSNTFSIITKVTQKIIPDSRVILFGSRARNDNDENSDYDFLIVTKQTLDIRKKRTLKAQLRKELAQYKIPADILIQSDREIKLKKEIPGHIIKQVTQEGIVL